jgi:two-component system, NtrC family, response regulator AtoC
VSARILIVEDDRTFRGLMQTILNGEGYTSKVAETAEEGLALLRRDQFDLVISDLKLPGMSGLDFFRADLKEGERPPFILLTAFGTIEEAVAAMKEGVADFLTKPLKDPDALRVLVRKILQAGIRERDYLALKETEAVGLPPDKLIFAGQAMAEVSQLVRDVAPTVTTVLLQGESGTGKELVARAIHLYSPRKQGAFVVVNCAAIPDKLLESELFGHERGAFTGAVAARRGKFELAQGGTLFLDEIGELPLTLQAKLLRVLQERRFERVGGSREIIAEVRVIAATNRDLTVEMQEKRFREDLFYRLNVFPICLPPLRSRIDILPDLVDYFIRRFARLTGKPVAGIEDDAMNALCNYGWPGNIRELQNVIERAVILGHGQLLGLKQLPETLVVPAVDDAGPSPLLEDVEHQAILDALDACGHNRRLTAERLGISKRTLQYRLKHYGLIDRE